MTVKTFILLQKKHHGFQKILAQFFSALITIKMFPKHQISIFILFLKGHVMWNRITLHFKIYKKRNPLFYLRIFDNTVLHVFDQIIAALVSIKYFFQKHYKSYCQQTFD